MSSILLYTEKTSNVNSGTHITARIVDGEKLEDIPSHAFPNPDDNITYSSFIIETERLIENLQDAKNLTINDQTFSIFYIRNVTDNPVHPKYDVITIKQD